MSILHLAPWDKHGHPLTATDEKYLCSLKLRYRSLRRLTLLSKMATGFNSCQVSYSRGLVWQFISKRSSSKQRISGQWAQNEIAVVPNFISEFCLAMTVASRKSFRCALWAGGILLQKR
ncbi:hypothetical protein TNCV_1892531 [Trichonephila clavipes]|nr:hypothetical protein TNCV_1892531 [Trichonephila clavipes]